MRHTRSLSFLTVTLAALGLACEPLPEDQLDEGAAVEEALASDPATKEAKAKTEASWVKQLEGKIPQELKDIVGAASKVSKVVNLVGQGVDAWNATAGLLGVLTATGSSPTMSPEFVALYHRLDELVGSLAYQHSQAFRNKIDSDLKVVLGHVEKAASQGLPLEGQYDLIAERALSDASELETLYQRLWTDRNPLPKNQAWKLYVPRPEVKNGFVYDWRGGYPALLLDTSLRLVIMATTNPNFANDSSFDVELKRLFDNILSHFNKIRDGVKCGRVETLELYDPVVEQAFPEVVTRVAPRFYDSSLKPGPEYLTRILCADIHTDAVIEHRVLGGAPKGPRHSEAVKDVERRMVQKIYDTQPTAETAEILLKLLRLRG